MCQKIRRGTVSAILCSPWIHQSSVGQDVKVYPSIAFFSCLVLREYFFRVLPAHESTKNEFMCL